ncbi:helix-turn-helix transcriptional regulator [Micromonospora sagamiensis]|uniref:Regulatory LuxR family protein n=1 Tax=Micromonospora sagamiensis TaxID=47875 RepID=A0A562WBQ9_9ACTN|nr:AAA family ATPase [Micromonospora sagamiensis]TWJ27646.1 regulatory LuxR family protein [Micromonospora sagamiensis]BCL13469.1 helix-turn-helix transcriptional regulator [Micromonospora sagamiensis]
MNPLVGREQILSSLGRHLDATLRGSSSCVVVDGPFGIGKTHLLKATALEGAERGLTVVAGRASITDQPIPIHLLINFLRHAMPGDVDFDELVRPDSNPFWLMDRVGELVESAARRHPLVVVLDDAQRIDDVSALALRGLVQSLASSPVLWLLARRPVASRSLAQHAVDWLIDHVAVRLHLGALDNEAVAELCTSILGAKPDASVLGWAERCGGNPWLMENVFSALIKAGKMIIADGAASVVTERLPDGVRAAVRGLLGEMSPAVRRLLVDGRRIGHTFTVDEVAALLGESAHDLASGVDEAVQVGLLRRDGVELTFTHQVVGEALQHAAFREREPAAPVPATVPAISTGATGGRSRAPSGGRPSPETGVRRPDTGGADARPERSGPVPAIVAPSAAPARSSGCECDDLAGRAVRNLAGPSDDAPRTLARALRLLAVAGRGAEACRLADVALRPGVEAAAEAQLVLELGQGLRDAGSHGLAAALVQRTLARPDVCELDRAKLGRALADSARRMGDAGGEVPAPGRGQPTVSRQCDTCERPLWTWLVRALVAADQFEEATAVLAAVRQETEKRAGAATGSLWYGHHAELLAAAGRLEEARVEAETALRLAERSAPEDSVPARLVLARVSLHRGDLATASDQLRLTERLMTGDASADRARLDWTLAQFHAASGRPAMMVQTLINIEGQVVPDPLLFTEVPTAAATLVRQARQVGLGPEAERAAEFARRLAERNPVVQSLAGGAEHAEGLLRNDPLALHRAADLHRLAGRPLAAASALEDAARVEQSMRDRTRAVRLLESAMDLYLECAAQCDLERVQKKLRRLDGHNVRRLGAERPKSGWESLTSAELRVVRAIVDGRTNREAASVLFLSPHTVDSHLRRVFSKLDISSRVELTRYFIAHEAFPPVMAAAHQPGSAV